jgi:hypothetical protein
LFAALAVPALAAGVARPALAENIMQNQYFNGDVNGYTSGTAPIQVDCQTGQPLAGQYVEVVPGSPAGSSLTGFTGSAGTAVTVTLDYPTGSGPKTVGTLTAYGTELAIPTTLDLPCTGSGTAVFTPTPTSQTAKPATVPIADAGQP